MKKAFWFALLILAVSCLDEPDCFQLNNNLVGISFRVMGSDIPDTLAIVGIQLSDADSTFNQQENATGVLLPMDITSDATLVTITEDGGIVRSMDLAYRVQTQYVSEDCGARFVLSDLNVTAHEFDSIRVVNASPTKNGTTNLEVYRCPQTNIMAIAFRDFFITSGGDSSNRAGAIALDGITTDHTGATVFYANTNLGIYYLPVNLAADQTTITFNVKNDAPKTLTVQYTRQNTVRYRPCGEQIFVSGLEISATDFEDATIALDEDDDERSRLTDPAETNVYLYRCPRTNLMNVDFKSRNSPTSTTLRKDTVTLKNITANYTSEIFYPGAVVSTVTLPVDVTQDVTEFYVTYADDHTDTVRLSYVRTPSTLFQSCGDQAIITGLLEQGDPDNTNNIRVIQDRDDLLFPPVSNLEIINN